MRKHIDQHVSTCHMCQVNSYKNALPAGRLIPIISNYPNEIVTLDLLGREDIESDTQPNGERKSRSGTKVANYVNDQHDKWDQFLSESAYAIRTAVNETTGKIPAKLFLSRKLITLFQKLVMVSVGTEVAVGDIERLFEEARRNTKAKHE
ncbi:uncharacterized protein TNCV_1748301 [Trichonephila clavipes]|nr:uncharacterized protein TNCV_1748301 [Trichonephila clavipes]